MWEPYSGLMVATIFIGVMQQGVEIASKQLASNQPRNDGLDETALQIIFLKINFSTPID